MEKLVLEDIWVETLDALEALARLRIHRNPDGTVVGTSKADIQALNLLKGDDRFDVSERNKNQVYGRWPERSRYDKPSDSTLASGTYSGRSSEG